MKTQQFISGCLVASALCIAGTNRAEATLAYDYTGVVGNQGSEAVSLGTIFTVGSTPINVNALGAFDNGANGMALSVQVAIYDMNSLARQGSVVTVGTTDGLIGPNTRGEALATPITLGSGTYVIVANRYGNIYEQNWNATKTPVGTAPTADTGGGYVSYGGNIKYADPFVVWGSTLPAGWVSDSGNTAVPGYAAGNFDFTPVPEASHFALAGIGLLGLVYTGRCLWQRRRVTA